MYILIIHSDDAIIANKIHNLIGGSIEKHITHFRIVSQQKINLTNLRKKFQIDINYLPKNFNIKEIKAFVSDMDSTLINIECIDEIADFIGIKTQVANITRDAMNGKINFDESLKQRLALLKNIDINVLYEIYNKRLQVNSGGKKLIAFLQSKKIKTAVVSGGFAFFTQRLKNDLKLDYQLANNIEVNDNKLTGKVIGQIINAQEKANFVYRMCDEQNIKLQQVITCGDGANDLAMMSISGLSIAYHAKEVVNNKADIIIQFSSLDKIIDLF